MTVVVFVHGTGVRAPSYARQLSLLTRRLGAVRPDVQVRPCFWGEQLGASLQAGGRSVSNYHGSGGSPSPHTDWDEARWEILRSDPLFELRVLAVVHQAQDPLPLLPGDEPPYNRYRRALDSLVCSPKFRTEVDRVGWGDELAAVLVEVLESEPAGAALLNSAADTQGEAREALARAAVAEAIRRKSDSDGTMHVEPATRNLLVSQIVDGLGGAPLGVGMTAIKIAGTLAMRVGLARAMERRRGLIADSLSPITGDVLRYLAHGASVRSLISDCVDRSDEPVVLMGHSLGGVMSVDTVAMELATPKMLITYGSQVPYLYELGALPSLQFGSSLPHDFPEWINILDERDLLAYPGEGLFGSHVKDIVIRHGDPFPQAHSRYLETGAFYDCLATHLP